jgi:hypothetical protein
MSETKKALALEALSSGLSIEKAGEVSHVSRQTVYNWLSQDDFKKELKVRQSEYFSQLAKRITILFMKALDVIEKSLDSRSEAMRLRASGLLISSYPHIAEMTEFEERLSALERVTGANK